MRSLALRQPQRGKVHEVVSTEKRLVVEVSRWYENAACKDKPWEDFDVQNHPMLTVSRAMKHCINCPVRRDCVVDAINKKDNGVVRGGINIRDRMPRRVCVRCDLPVAEESGLCTFCAMSRICAQCGKKFALKVIYDTTLRCSDCIAEAKFRYENRKRRLLPRRKKSK